MFYSLEEKVKWFAVFSRISLIFLNIFFNHIIPDHNARVFKKPQDVNINETQVDEAISFLLEGFSRWDGQHFLHVAQYGYTYEHTVAFFPLFPLVIRHLTLLFLFLINNMLGSFLPCHNIVSAHSSLLFTAVLFNNILFVKTAIVLFQLSTVVLKNERLAYISAILFCINPASIFFSSIYSETLYCYLTFYGLLLLTKNNSIVSNIVLGLSGLARSNGLINTGFVCYKYLQLRLNDKSILSFSMCLLQLCLTVLPFIMYQIYCHARFCIPNEVSLPDFIIAYGSTNDFVFPGRGSSWCNSSIPLAYSYVQDHYWDVGFLRFYQWKQIPNFLLAFPIICIILRASFSFMKKYRKLLLFLGLVEAQAQDELPLSCFVYVFHCIILTLFALLMIHVHVSTRMLASSCPVFYWFCALIVSHSVRETNESKLLSKLCQKGEKQYYECFENRKSRWKTFIITESFDGPARFVKYYFISYFVVGTLLFSNNLPWT